MRASGACGTIIASETPWKECPSWGSVGAAASMSSPCSSSGTQATACALPAEASRAFRPDGKRR